jgi:hypothetical protein
MHVWDEPIEALFSFAPSRGMQLLTSMLRSPTEPTRGDGPHPWWRAAVAQERAAGQTGSVPETSDDLSAVSWPVD